MGGKSIAFKSIFHYYRLNIAFTNKDLLQFVANYNSRALWISGKVFSVEHLDQPLIDRVTGCTRKSPRVTKYHSSI